MILVGGSQRSCYMRIYSEHEDCEDGVGDCLNRMG